VKTLLELNFLLEPRGIDILTSVRDRDWVKTLGLVRDRDGKWFWDLVNLVTLGWEHHVCVLSGPLVCV
jgi:hypothetical protein